MFLLSFFATIVFAQEEEPTFWNPTDHPLITAVPPITARTTPMGRGYTQLSITNNTTAEIMIDLRTQGMDYGFESDNGLRILKAQVDEVCPIDTTNSTRNETWDYAECQLKLLAGQAIDLVIVTNPIETEVEMLADVTIVAAPKAGLPNPAWGYLVSKAITVHKAKPVIIPETPEEEE